MWKSKSLRSLHLFYLLSFIIVGAYLALLLYQAEHLPITSTAPADLDIKKENPITEVRKLVESGETSRAAQQIDRIQKRKTITNKKVMTSLVGLQESLVSFSTLPDGRATLRSVFLKVNNLLDSTRKNRWARLEKISRDLAVKIESYSKAKSDNEMTLEDLSRSIEHATGMMRAITSGSGLKPELKQMILNDLFTIEKDRQVMSEYLKRAKDLNIRLDSTIAEYQKELDITIESELVSTIEKESSLLFKIKKENLLYGGLFLVILLAIAGSILYQKAQVKAEIEFRELFSEVLDVSLIPVRSQQAKSFSETTTEKINYYHDYLQKRMSFGAVFQETLPFASLLLDSNLKVIWANGLFYDFWGLSDYKGKHEGLSWDYLQKCTNLGESTPLNDALKSKIAGIYQINLKGVNHKESFPYEMYVSPIEYEGQIRIMVLFYPLKSLEEGLSMQLDSIRGTIGKTIQKINEGGFDEHFKVQIKSELDSNGLDDIYDSLAKLEKDHHEKTKHLTEKIDSLSYELEEKSQSLAVLKAGVTKSKRDIEEEIVLFTSIRDELLALIEGRDEVKDYAKNLFVIGKEGQDNIHQLIENAELMEDITAECVKILGSTEKGRGQLKTLRTEIETEKSSIVQQIDRMIVFGKSGNNEDLVALKNSIREFEKKILFLDKVIVDVDVALNKIDHVVLDFEKIEIGHIKERVVENSGMIDGHYNALFNALSKSEEKDDGLVKLLQESYQAHKKIIKDTSSLSLVFEEESAKSEERLDA